jgi:cytochrome P450
MSFYFAGIDTTGHLLSFALYSAAQYPNFCAKLEEEINSIIKVEEDLTYDKIKVYR